MTAPSSIRAKLDFSQFLASPGDISGGDTTTFNLLSTKAQQDNQREAEIIELKTKLANAETRMQNAEKKRKLDKIEFEKKLQDQRNEHARRLDRYKGSRQQQQELANQKEDLEKRLNETSQELQTCKTLVATLNQEKMNLMNQLSKETKLRHTESAKTSSLEKHILELESNLSVVTAELDSVKQQLNIHRTRNSELHSELLDLEEYKSQARSSECHVKELQEKLSRLEEDAVVVKGMRARVSQFPELERKNKELQEEIQVLKEREENMYLLKEQRRDANVKLERAQAKLVQFDQLNTQVGILQARLKEYEFVDSNGKVKMLQPDEMKQRISDLQVENSRLVDSQGQRTAEVHRLENKLQEAGQNLSQMRAQLQQQHNSANQSAELAKRVRRKMNLFQKERDSLKAILDSYESEMTVNVGQVTNQRIKQLEEIIQTYQHQMSTLEQEVDLKNQTVVELQTRCNQLEQQLQSPGSTAFQPVTVSSQVDQQIIASLRKQLSELQAQYDKTLESKEILEARIDQRHMQGEYDPLETKVVHFRMNPADLAQQRRALELSKLKEENETLRKRLHLLEESGGAAVEDLTLKVNLQPPTDSKQTEELKAELEQAQKKSQRLREVFKQTTHDIREVLCYQLLGYRFDIPGTNQYRLMNMYAESESDYLNFQQSADGEVHLLENDYTQTLTDKMDVYLKTHHSFPAFLAALTLDLFQRQTMIMS